MVTRTRMMRVSVVIVALAVSGVGHAMDIEDVDAPELPAVFARAGVAKTLSAKRVARLDAYRKLAERMVGMALDSKTDVYDCVIASDAVKNRFLGRLVGMRDTEVKYFDDGRVAIEVTVTLREIVEIIETAYKRAEKGKRLVSEESLRSVKRENRDKKITVIGFGALEDSPGLKKIRAMRAAELNCYERIARRVHGITISGGTTISRFMLANDRIFSRVSVQLLNGVRLRGYKFYADGKCEVKGELTIRQIVEVLTRTYLRHTEGRKLVKLEDIQSLTRKHEDLIITETGEGAPRGAQPAPAPFVFVEKKTIFMKVMRKERVIKKGVVVE